MKKSLINIVMLMFALAVSICSTTLFAKAFSQSEVSDDRPAFSRLSKNKLNYVIIHEGKSAKVISWQNGNTPDKPRPKVNRANNIVIAPTFKSIPLQYQHYPAGSVVPIDLPIAALMGRQQSESVRLTLPTGQFSVVNDAVLHDEASKTWIGHLSEAGAGYQMVLSEGAAGVMGHINTPQGTLMVEGDGDAAYLIDTQRLSLIGFDDDAVAPGKLDGTAVASMPMSKRKLTGADKIAVVDLMVLYTTATTTADFAKQRIEYLVNTSNKAYQDSGIKMKLRLVNAESTRYSESVSNAQALDDLTNARGVFTGIHAKRAQVGADLVFLFRPLHANTHGNCGTTYVGFANGTAANSAYGFGTISDGIAKEPEVTSFCEINTFTHEIGHSLGLVHDIEYSAFPGAFHYSYAWGVKDKFGTIMSYKLPMVMLFSTPDLANQCVGLPCGSDETDAGKNANQVKSVNITAPQVANYLPTVVRVKIPKNRPVRP